MTLINHFCKSIETNGQTIEGILNEIILREQSDHFALTRMHQFEESKKLENPLEERSVTRVWKKIGHGAQLANSLSKFLKLVDLCQNMILGSVEDGRFLVL